MSNETITVGTDLDAAASAKFVQHACRFASGIKLKVGPNTINAKSMLGVMNVGLFTGKSVTVEAQGDDEKQAVSELCNFLKG